MGPVTSENRTNRPRPGHPLPPRCVQGDVRLVFVAGARCALSAGASDLDRNLPATTRNSLKEPRDLMSTLPLLLQAGGGDRRDIIALILNASPVVKGVMGMLIGMSVASWFVIGSKSIYLSIATSRAMRFQEMFWKTGRLVDIWRATEALKPLLVCVVFCVGFFV